ncbi:MAG: vitamin B12-dependent ribonucleotide reductase, partial [Nanoarchaeota archaeon]
AVRLWTITLEISVLMAQFPAAKMAELSYKYRTLGLGYANIGSMLMRMGVPYDSDMGRAIGGALTAIMTGCAYETSAEMASYLGAFAEYQSNKEDMLRVIRNHRSAAYDENQYEGLTVTPLGIDQKLCPSYLLEVAQRTWDQALEKGESFGYRNAQVTVLAPTGTIGLLMDCDTTGVEPDFALVKFKKLAGGGYFKIVNQAVPIALETLGYQKEQIDAIIKYCIGHGKLEGCPHINRESLKAKGLDEKTLDAVESQLQNAFDVKFVFNRYTLGDDVCKAIGVTDAEMNDPQLNILAKLGFSDAEIAEANEYICGTMTVEGAPYIRDEHLPVFDCANRCGSLGKRFIHYMGHINFMAAAQPFLSGAISKTINMPNEATIEEISTAYTESWKRMLKAVALYRDGSKLSQPLNTVTESETLTALLTSEDDESLGPADIHSHAVAAAKQPLPAERKGITEDVSIAGHPLVIRTGEYEDGSLGEIQVDMYKRGSSYGELMTAFSQAVSIALQYGVPLEEFIDKFTFTRFDPQGMVGGHKNIKSATSPVDFIFRSLGFTYMGRKDLVHVKDEHKEDPGKQKKSDSGDKKASEAKNKGYTGESCSNCGSMRLRRNGTCSVCEDCGTTTGCS